jgi:hypothetical protein
MNTVMVDSQPMAYTIGCERAAAMDKLKKADFMSAFAPSVMGFLKELGSVINGTRPLQVPMSWSFYYERVWDPRYVSTKPCMEINPRYLDPYYTDVKYIGDIHSSIEEILNGRLIITVNCEPCWETYKRWGSAILDDFYKAMRAVRAHYGFDKWDDNSEPTVKWGNPKYIYSSPRRQPLVTLTQDLQRVIEMYGERYTQQTLEICVTFHFEMPATPESELNSANCHVVEEEVQETVTRKVKTLKCA